MPIKSQRDKKRYIAFKVHAPRSISRKEFIAAIRGNIKDDNSWNTMKPWLTVFGDNAGILRCTHIAKDEARELLNSIKSAGREKTEVKVETLTTSGTIKKAKEILETIK
jgi:RNase P/RNase MRP subunit POP5